MADLENLLARERASQIVITPEGDMQRYANARYVATPDNDDWYYEIDGLVLEFI